MLNVKIIVVGGLKEKYLRDAAAEYEKRLSAFCSISAVEIKEAKLSDNPSSAQISAALEEEGKRIISAIPPRSYVVAMAIEGDMLSSEELSEKMNEASLRCGTICFIIGGSHGLSESVKAAASLRLSMSRLTFPHQLARIMLLEAVYRSFSIMKGMKYHK